MIADPLAATLPGRLEISLLVLVLTALVFAIFVVGERLSSRISASALQVLTKVMGLLLTAIAVEMLFSGFKAAFPVLAQGAS